MPISKRPAAKRHENINGRRGKVEVPRIAQRNPSITPTIGFNSYSQSHFSGTILLENPTGETYRPN
jgi:hypothetical protein